MGTPVFLKFVRLVSAVLFIQINTDFLYVSEAWCCPRLCRCGGSANAERLHVVWSSTVRQCVSRGSRISCSTIDGLAAFLSAYTGHYKQDTGAQCCHKYVHVSTSTVMLMCQWCLTSHVVSEEPVWAYLDLRLELYPSDYP